MPALSKHGPRIAVTLLPLLLAVLHAVGVLPMGVLQRLDDIIYDARLRATMPATRDERVVIVDIDEKSLAEVGRWPWAGLAKPVPHRGVEGDAAATIDPAQDRFPGGCPGCVGRAGAAGGADTTPACLERQRGGPACADCGHEAVVARM